LSAIFKLIHFYQPAWGLSFSFFLRKKKDSVMSLLVPYLDIGWKLVTSYSIVIGGNGSAIITRYFLRKEE